VNTAAPPMDGLMTAPALWLQNSEPTNTHYIRRGLAHAVWRLQLKSPVLCEACYLGRL
jgi:hypothetical protein